MPSTQETLAGLKVLVVEDSYLIAEHVSDLLAQYGAEVIGPVARLGPGLKLVESTLRSLVSLEPGAFSAHGPEVLLTPNAAATLGMVIYELATNATKYGALSQPSGRLDVQWQLVGPTQGGRVELSWTESGGRKVPRELTPGFGLNFITRSIEYEMQGKAEREPAQAAQNMQRT